ncbi:MAG: BamA/TamA family outer membrane protein [Thermoanaerobaculia bacterium]
MTRSMHRRFVSGLFAAGLLLAFAPLYSQDYGGGALIAGAGFSKNKIQYRDFKWEIYHSPHFNLYYYQEEKPQLQKVVSFAESAYDKLSREFNFQIKDPVPLIYFATHSAFEQNNVLLNFIPEGVGAFASPARFRMVLPIDVPDPELYQLISHELTHIFQYHMLFQGSLAKAVASGPPTWFMEGMASYMAKDESQRDRMYLRDAVVNDRIPSVARGEVEGFFAYRFGHAVFDFIEERWGREGFLDFIYEVRNTIGSRVDRAIKRTFKIEPEDFDIEFRRWLRKKYLPQLVQTGEPSDFGRIFRVEQDRTGGSEAISPVASPSGDLVAALTGYRGKVDVVLFDAKNRRLIRNLTRGFASQYQYLICQELTTGRRLGRDLAFSPDGNTLAVFAKRERGRSLLLIDVLSGRLNTVIDMFDVEQQGAPVYSPDGRTVAFYGWQNGQFDIFALDLETRKISHITDDDVFDGAPAFSPDGKSVFFVSTVSTGNKIFRVDLDHPGTRYQVTSGQSNENDPTFSPDGKRLYFTSDRSGPENIFSLELAAGKLRQHTDVVTGAFMPTVLRETDGPERVVYGGYWRQSFDLYVANTDEPVKEPQKLEIPAAPAETKDLPHFEPDIQVSLDDANKEKYHGRKFFLEDAQTFIGVNSDQSYQGRILLSFSDYLGDHRIFANLSSIDSFSNFDVTYADLTHRLQWQLEAFDYRTFFQTGDPLLNPTQGRTDYAITGAVASLVYPFSFYQRAELGVGYLWRKEAIPFVNQDGSIGFTPTFRDNFPLIQGAWMGDSAVFDNYGAISGRRWRLNLSYALDTQQSGTKYTSADLEIRQYIHLTQRSNFAFRLFAGESNGNAPPPYYFGGLDTVRGVNFRSLVGDRAFFANFELRFPLIDVLATPVLAFQGIRGVIFMDVGGAYYHGIETFRFYNSDTGALQNAVASYGWGLTARILGLDFNWDFARPYDLKHSGRFATEFWIGYRF